MAKSKKRKEVEILNNQNINKDELLKKMFKLMLESLMEGERTAVLGYGKHDPQGYRENGIGNGNSRNGYYERDLLTGLGLLEKLDIPRDRLGEFTPQLLDKWQRATKPMDELVMSLYAKGMATRDINDIVEKIYGKAYSPQQVSLITKEIEEEQMAWEKRSLKKKYIAIFIDALFVKLRRGDTVSADAVYVVCGIDDKGYRDIMGRYERQRLNGFAAYQLDLSIMWQKHYGKSGENEGIVLEEGGSRFTQNT